MLATRRRLRLLTAAGAVVLALALSGCSGGSNAVDQTANGQFRYVGGTTRGQLIPQNERKIAGDASAPYLSGGSGTWHLSTTRGQVAVINYWGSWCPPCVIETPVFNKIYLSMKSSGVTFVGIDVKESSKSKPLAFIADNNISYPIVYDQPMETAIELGRIPSSGLPNTVLVDRQGRVAAVYTGALSAGDLEPVLAKLAAEK